MVRDTNSGETGRSGNHKRNYQKELEQVMMQNEKAGKIPSLFLHSCCAPCSSYVLEYLSAFFNITVFYYNPNIYPPEEYGGREAETERLIKELPVRHPISLVKGEYHPEDFYEAVRGHEADREGEGRCELCFRLRLEESARLAAEGGYDYFTTTLSISPLKDAELLNALGEELGSRYGVTYLNSDFKKKNGYRRSTELSREYGLYRQDYCGCIFSKREREETERQNR